MPNVPQIEAQRKRVRFGSEETPRPAKKPRRKAGLRAQRGVSELEQVTGIEPAWSAWEAVELTFPLHLIAVANP